MAAREVMAGVTVNPEVSFGRPCIKGTGISTEAIACRFRGGDSVEMIAYDYWPEATIANYRETSARIEAALRWELLSPAVRKRRIAKALAGEAQ